ncbi:MAG: YdcF family protein [Candidatus Omnitrophica bacterium]|nr:YdcF family protein [Candidatus Omnitrophota bacterium]
MLRGRDILCISTIDWDFIWQGHQEIMATLAAAGNRVLFIENTGVRAPGLRDIGRLKQRLRNWQHSTKGFRQVAENLFVYSPVILPFPYSRLARWMNRGLLLRAIQRWMHAVGFRRPIVWTFLPTPLAREIIRAVDPLVTIYYCIDDFASSSPQARRIRASETQLLRDVNLVFVTSEKLRERAARDNPRVHVFPFGVSFEQFERIRAAGNGDGAPRDLQALPRPVVGYVGGIHQWFDQELLAAVARRLPHVSFALIGPAQTDVSALSGCPNIHLLNARPHTDVPAYIKGFDVGIISYRLTEYTAHVYPTKLNEYLAMGIPVVATDLPEIRRFNAEHGELVAIGRTADEFADVLQRSLQRQEPSAVQRRIAAARRNSWHARIDAMSALIEERLRASDASAQRWDTLLRRLYRAAKRRAAATALAAILVYLVLFQSPFVWWTAEPLRMEQAPRRAEAIVVFAGGVGESGKAGGGYQERVKHAVDLYAQGLAPRMIFSSGYTFVFREAEVMRDLAVTLGVPEEAILLETRAANTHENAAFVSAILRDHGWRSALLVSSPYHMRRAMLSLRRTAPELAVTPSPVPHSQFYAHSKGASLEQIRGILQEYASIVYYVLRGWI